MPEKIIKQLVAKRTSIKSQLSNFQNFINNIDKSNLMQLPEVQLKLEKLISKQDQFGNIQLDIEVATDNAPVQLFIRQEIENVFEILIIHARDYIHLYQNEVNQTGTAFNKTVKLQGITNVKLS